MTNEHSSFTYTWTIERLFNLLRIKPHKSQKFTYLAIWRNSIKYADYEMNFSQENELIVSVYWSAKKQCY